MQAGPQAQPQQQTDPFVDAAVRLERLIHAVG